MKRLKAEDGVSVSKVSATEWAYISSAAGVQVQTTSLPNIATSRSVEEFAWSDQEEGAQADR